jgi:AcrR family transcriptional regulator
VRTTGRASTKKATAARKAPITPKRRRTGLEIRKLLLDAARAEFRAKGFDGATTAAIAKRAHVAEIQLYRAFPSKTDLFSEAIFAPVLEHFRVFNAKHRDLSEADDAVIREKANRYVIELISLLNDNTRLLASLLSPAKDAAKPNSENPFGEVLQTFLDEIAAIMATRAITPTEIDAATIGRIAFASILGCVSYRDWLFPDAGKNPAAIDRAMAQFILAGISPYSDIGQSAVRPKRGKR